MRKNYNLTIGIEIHLELKTKTKMFSSAPNVFGAKPNTMVSPIDLGYPGTLPQVNEQAVVFAIKLAKVLHMKIDDKLRFDRKHYFYPDLPKNYQITQQNFPIGKNGELLINVDGVPKIIEIERIHLEEDTANQIHSGNLTYLNFNRAGIPLIEIVTKPCMHTVAEALEYVKQLRLIALYLDISDAKMEEGSLRVDVNISMTDFAGQGLGNKVEIKNINSITNVGKAIELEIANQSDCLAKGVVIPSVTKRFNDKNLTNEVLRAKDTVIDYTYMPEPNIPTIYLRDEFINGIQIPPTPNEKRTHYEALKLTDRMVNDLVENLPLANYFEAVQYKNALKTVNVIFAELVPLARKLDVQVDQLGIAPTDLKVILEKLEQNLISSKQLKDILGKLANKEITMDVINKIANSQTEDDEAVLKAHIESIIKSINDVKVDYQERPERVTKYVMGQLMRLTKGKANPKLAVRLLEEILKSS